MAIIPKDAYPGQIDTTDLAYPLGKSQNISAPGAGDGTPWESLNVNDVYGFFQALLVHAGITASGSPDKVGASQYLDSLVAKFEAVFSKNSAFNLDFGLTTDDIIEIGTDLVASRTLETDGSGKAISVVKKTGHNKDFGTAAGTVVEGNDARLAGVAGKLKAWVRFDGTGTVAIDREVGVLSVTDNGTGDYTVTLDDPVGADSLALISCKENDDDSVQAHSGQVRQVTTTTFRIRTYDTNSGNAEDSEVVYLGIFE